MPRMSASLHNNYVFLPPPLLTGLNGLWATLLFTVLFRLLLTIARAKMNSTVSSVQTAAQGT